MKRTRVFHSLFPAPSHDPSGETPVIPDALRDSRVGYILRDAPFHIKGRPVCPSRSVALGAVRAETIPNAMRALVEDPRCACPHAATVPCAQVQIRTIGQCLVGKNETTPYEPGGLIVIRIGVRR